MTPDPITRLQALSEKATAGQWHCERAAWISGPEHKGIIADCCPTYGGANDSHKADAALIVAAVNVARFLADDASVEAMARRFAYDRWPLATTEEREAWANDNWSDFIVEARSIRRLLAGIAVGEGET